MQMTPDADRIRIYKNIQFKTGEHQDERNLLMRPLCT